MWYTFRQTPAANTWAACVTAALAALAGGCAAPSGVWVLVEVDPPGAPFPFAKVQFSNGGDHRAQSKAVPLSEASLPSQMTTDWLDDTAGLVRLAPGGRNPPGMRSRLRLDGKLLITIQPPGRNWKVSGIFRRANPVEKELLNAHKSIAAQTPETSKGPTIEDQRDGP